MNRRASLLVALAASVLLVYAWRLDFSPPDLADDEVVFALQAHSIATTAHDLSGRLLPLYFQMGPLGESSWFHPALVYFSLPFAWILPTTEAAVRLPTAVIGLITILLTYGIGRRLLGSDNGALVAAALLALTPAHFMLSRLTADYLYPVPFILGWLWSLLVFLDGGNPRVLFVATLCLGVGVYSYIASLITMPFYLAITLAVIAWRRRDAVRLGAIALAGFMLPLLLVPAWLAFHPQVVSQTLARYGQTSPVPIAGATAGMSLDAAMQEVRRPVHFSGLLRRISLYWYFFDPGYLFVTGGYANPINSTRHTAVFLVSMIAFVPVGLWRLATRGRSTADVLVLVGFLSAPVAAIFVPEPYAVDREAALMAFGALVAAIGVAAMWSSGSVWVRRSALALLLLMPLQFSFFLFEYFTSYRGQAAFWFGFNHRGAVESMIDRATREPVPSFYLTTAGDPVIGAYWQFALLKRHREDLLPKTVYFDPEKLDVSNVPRGSLLLSPHENADMTRRIASGELRKIADVPEIADPPQFMIMQR